MLACPTCQGRLDWTIIQRSGDRIEMGEASCAACATSYPVQDGIGIFLTPDLPREDLWEEVDSQLVQHLRQHPDLERKLMGGPLDGLGPADQYFRAAVLEERGDYAGAQAAEEAANLGLYTPDYLCCWENQYNYVIQQLSASDAPMVDLASGRCYLVEKLARDLEVPLVATDFSPRVLRRDRRWFEFLGLYDRISLLAIDARRTPFKAGAVKTLTTNLGLPNISQPGSLLQELRRVVDGRFLAISFFYPEDDATNGALIREAGVDVLLYRRKALEAFARSGWHVEVANSCFGRALPTPASEVLEGAAIDALPVAETTLEWGVLAARNTE